MHSADDDANWETAKRLARDFPDWLVVWGVYTRQYVAFPLFDAPRGTILAARDPSALAARLQQAEWRRRSSPPERRH
jgi:hypothetical protein